MNYQSLFEFFPEKLQQLIRNRYYENKIRKANIGEEEELKLLSKTISSGENVVDIGANYGLYTKHLSKFTGAEGKVFAVEPIHKSFISLSNNVKKMKWANVKLFNCALSDEVGFATMEIPRYRKGGENLYEARMSSGHKKLRSEKVMVETLDKLIPENVIIHFIKCDVEGHEYRVLKGGLRILEKSRPWLMLEINGGINKKNRDAVEIVSLLGSLDYQAFIYRDSKLKPVLTDDNSINYFFLASAHRDKFSELIAGA